MLLIVVWKNSFHRNASYQQLNGQKPVKDTSLCSNRSVGLTAVKMKGRSL